MGCTRSYTSIIDTSSVGRGDEDFDDFLEVTERKYEVVLYDPRGVRFNVECFSILDGLVKIPHLWLQHGGV